MTEKTEITLAPEKKRLKIFGVELVYLYLFGIVVAFFAWMIENISCIFSIGQIDSRYHILPFISPYASIVLAFHIALRDPDEITFFGKRIFKGNGLKEKILSNVIAFLIIAFCVAGGELAVGNIYEHCFGVILWDYSEMPLHITRYTSVFTILGFGAAAYCLFRFIYKPFLAFLRRRVPFRLAKWICLTLGMAIIADTLRLMLTIVIAGEAPLFWAIKLR